MVQVWTKYMISTDTPWQPTPAESAEVRSLSVEDNATQDTDHDLRGPEGGEPGVDDDPQLDASIMWMLWCVLLPIFAALGIVGNVLTVVVMSGKGKGERSRSGVSLANYFVALAISDTLLLLSITAVEWGSNIFGREVVIVSKVVCQVHVFIINACSSTSSWYLVGLTAQRTIAVLSPHRLAPKCTPAVRLGCLLLMTLAACLLHAHNFVGFRPGYDTQHVTVCDDVYRNASNSSEDVTDNHPLMDTLLGGPIPFGLLILCNGLLLRKVYASMVFAKTACASSDMTSRENKMTSLTLTVVMTSLTFVFLTSPALGFILYRHIMFPGASHHLPLKSDMKLIKTVCYLMWVCNNAVNFYIYCLTGTKFRQQLRVIFRCQRWSPVLARGTTHNHHHQHHHPHEQHRVATVKNELRLMKLRKTIIGTHSMYMSMPGEKANETNMEANPDQNEQNDSGDRDSANEGDTGHCRLSSASWPPIPFFHIGDV